ncbi:MAG: glycine betaine/L-proline ABC transporter permease ProW [Sneathiellaceae bacterium]
MSEMQVAQVNEDAVPEAQGMSPEGAADNPWGSATAPPAENDTGEGWLDAAGPAPEAPPFEIFDPFAQTMLPIGTWIDSGLGWLVDNFRPLFQAIRWPIDLLLQAMEGLLTGLSPWIVLAVIGLGAWQLAGGRLAIGAILSMIVVGLVGAWDEAMVTLSLVITSVLFCIAIGLPTGIWLARSDRAATAMRPILDAMQTTPAFVYLVPIVMLFGIGNVPGVVVTIIFALPPLIRLTNLGIRQVPPDLVEAATSFGASRRQLLYKVQLPMAMPTIMAGINQTLMLALSMVVIASMIAVGGLGQMVLRGIGRLDMGLAVTGGVGIVILAIIIDRLTQALGRPQREKGYRHWTETGPAALVLRVLRPSRNRPSAAAEAAAPGSGTGGSVPRQTGPAGSA